MQFEMGMERKQQDEALTYRARCAQHACNCISGSCHCQKRRFYSPHFFLGNSRFSVVKCSASMMADAGANSGANQRSQRLGLVPCACDATRGAGGRPLEWSGKCNPDHGACPSMTRKPSEHASTVPKQSREKRHEAFCLAWGFSRHRHRHRHGILNKDGCSSKGNLETWSRLRSLSTPDDDEPLGPGCNTP